MYVGTYVPKINVWYVGKVRINVFGVWWVQCV